MLGLARTENKTFGKARLDLYHLQFVEIQVHHITVEPGYLHAIQLLQ